jgi:hypothetical protein
MRMHRKGAGATTSAKGGTASADVLTTARTAAAAICRERKELR